MLWRSGPLLSGVTHRGHYHTGLGVPVHVDPWVAGGVQAADLPPPITFPLSFFPFPPSPTIFFPLALDSLK